MNASQTNAVVPSSRWRWWIHLFLIGGYFTAQIPLAFFHVRSRPVLTSSVRGFLIVSAVELVLFAVVFALGWMASRASREQLLLPWRPGGWVVPLAAVYSVGIRIGVGLIAAAVVFFLILLRVFTLDGLQEFFRAARPDVERIVDVSALQNNPVYFWLVLTIGSFVLAGFREELWRAGTLAGMRALWPKAFSGRNGEFAAIAIIAVIFGAGHLGMGWLAAVLAGILGLFLGAIMLIHRSIWPAVFAHGFFDAVSFALLPHALEYARRVH